MACGWGGEEEEERGRHLDCDARIVKIDSEGLGKKQENKPKDRLGWRRLTMTQLPDQQEGR